MTVGIFTLAGVALGFLGQWLLQWQRRAEAVADRSRAEQLKAYVALLVSVNELRTNLAASPSTPTALPLTLRLGPRPPISSTRT